MKEKLKLLLCLFIAILSLTTLAVKYKDSRNSNDANKFKEEYEVYNKKYIKLSIDKNNPIKYKSEGDILDIIKNKTGIIYLGHPDSNECRNAINVLLILK